jgi:hypothetical protein
MVGVLVVELGVVAVGAAVLVFVFPVSDESAPPQAHTEQARATSKRGVGAVLRAYEGLWGSRVMSERHDDSRSDKVPEVEIALFRRRKSVAPVPAREPVQRSTLWNGGVSPVLLRCFHGRRDASFAPLVVVEFSIAVCVELFQQPCMPFVATALQLIAKCVVFVRIQVAVRVELSDPAELSMHSSGLAALGPLAY